MFTHLAFLVTSESVFIFIPPNTGIAQAAWGCKTDTAFTLLLVLLTHGCKN